ncbi:aminotransferase class I/II-fold pyridoxal phosphate-dependent enzyme [Dehalobacterium formicoaceticum]|uniref:Methionine gamma-lyase family protein n=1 Tax=Dehalobacterium formicoaceticum TaxID=51515 RepID=A0ABT1Y4Z4_9FIRM|nr:methionine gamma-lyase family protein [Dehalobacterium formicoaceticum]MCR6545943.1 methionine gamma-lyase family protein [Dehalobacterium formicoaceticum]
MELDTRIVLAETAAERSQQEINENVSYNLHKVLTAFRNHKISELHLQSSTGYGYNDVGRDGLEAVYREIFCGEEALVRHQVVSGTHAITLAYFGNLFPGDELLSVGTPYDTLLKVIGSEKKEMGTLRELGIAYREVPLAENGSIDLTTVLDAISPKTKMVSLQRSKGYQWRPSLTIDEIAVVTKGIKSRWPHVIVFVDNCYGEFVEKKEPLEVGADLIAGSLIKNPGGGIAPCGGYIVGKKELVERAAMRLTAPGIGGEIGPSLGNNRLFYQGLFHAPHVVGEALWGAVFTASLCAGLGLEVMPQEDGIRTDIIQAIKMGNRERVLAFCQGIQRYSPIDSHVTPIAWDMPGYEDQVIMAAGAFVQGSSIELSADGPVREPYIVYMQGGTSRQHVKLAVTETIREMIMNGLL